MLFFLVERTDLAIKSDLEREDVGIVGTGILLCFPFLFNSKGDTKRESITMVINMMILYKLGNS